MSTMERSGYLNEQVLSELEALNTVADINSVFINREGKITDHPINHKVIGLGLEQLKKTKTVVGMAFGLHKIDCILAALRGVILICSLRMKRQLLKLRKFNIQRSSYRSFLKQVATEANFCSMEPGERKSSPELHIH